MREFDSVAMLKIGDLKSVDGIITDSNISQQMLDKYEKQDVNVFIENLSNRNYLVHWRSLFTDERQSLFALFHLSAYFKTYAANTLCTL